MRLAVVGCGVIGNLHAETIAGLTHQTAGAIGQAATRNLERLFRLAPPPH